jgi:aspartyl/asparaginyl beta-hydroxylase (cupin superfamily)
VQLSRHGISHRDVKIVDGDIERPLSNRVAKALNRFIGKRLKAWNRTAYYVIKWALLGCVAYAVFVQV